MDFKETIERIDPDAPFFDRLETLQVNLGNICNQYCIHCHVDAGPAGTKTMEREVIDRIINILKVKREISLDITGGCPELNPYFRYLVEGAYGSISRIMVRTNLTILLEEGMGWILEWYKEHRVTLIASLPCYLKENVDRQRGEGVFERSIEALKRLNELGYGDSLELNLVYNPGGDFLPPPQQELEMDYKERLKDYGIRFTNLFTITNAPIGRFKNYLKANGRLEDYISLLKRSFNPKVVSKIMCRRLINVGWDGTLYNCDFNQALGLPIRGKDGRILDIDHIEEAINNRYDIAMGDHCYSCTAGAGSSCTGELG